MKYLFVILLFGLMGCSKTSTDLERVKLIEESFDQEIKEIYSLGWKEYIVKDQNNFVWFVSVRDYQKDLKVNKKQKLFNGCD